MLPPAAESGPLDVNVIISIKQLRLGNSLISCPHGIQGGSLRRGLQSVIFAAKPKSMGGWWLCPTPKRVPFRAQEDDKDFVL